MFVKIVELIQQRQRFYSVTDLFGFYQEMSSLYATIWDYHNYFTSFLNSNLYYFLQIIKVNEIGFIQVCLKGQGL